jgi:hypothetical protein
MLTGEGAAARGRGAEASGQAHRTLAELKASLQPQDAALLEAETNKNNSAAEALQAEGMYKRARAAAVPGFEEAAKMSAQARQTAAAAKAAAGSGNKTGAQKQYQASVRIYQAALSKYGAVLDKHNDVIKTIGLSDAAKKQIDDEVVAPAKAELDRAKQEMDAAKAAIETPAQTGRTGTASTTANPTQKPTAKTVADLDALINGGQSAGQGLNIQTPQ